MAKKSEIATWKKEKRKEKKRVRDRAAAAAPAAVIKYYFRYFTISLVLFNGSLIVMMFKSRAYLDVYEYYLKMIRFCYFVAVCCCFESYRLCVNRTRLNEVRYFSHLTGFDREIQYKTEIMISHSITIRAVAQQKPDQSIPLYVYYTKLYV